jgi:hypothetical protein
VTLSTTPEITPAPGSGGTGSSAVVNGTPNMFNPTVGDTSSGGHGPINTTFDGIPCEEYMSNNYHIHVFVGLYVNGQEVAIPTGTGAVEPAIDKYGDSPGATSCLYFTHTHDSTGVVHIESDNQGIVESTPSDSKFSLGQWFSIWGITVNAMQFGQFQGPVEVLTSGQTYRGGPGSATIPETDLTVWKGDPNAIPLYSHEVIWFLVGPNYPTTLPEIHFFEEF